MSNLLSNSTSSSTLLTPPGTESSGLDRSIPRSIDTDADSLMDELFGEVEHILTTGSVPPETPLHPEFIAIKPLPVPQLQTPLALLPLDLSPLNTAESAPDQALVDVEAVASESKGGNLWLLGAVLLSFGTLLGLIWLNPNPYFRLLAQLQGKTWQSPQTQASLPEIDPIEAEERQQFIRYLERSLRLIDENQAAASSSANPAQSLTNLPPVAVASNPGVVASSLVTPTQGSPGVNIGANPGINTGVNTNVVERVYIPIYQNPTADPNGLLPSSGLPTIAAPLPLGSPLPNVISAQTPGVPSPGTASAASTTALAPTPSPITHTLVGILELGDRSAALFEINGVTRRIHLGEAIASSGWLLVEVANQEAIVRRNGEVRSIYVGQAF